MGAEIAFAAHIEALEFLHYFMGAQPVVGGGNGEMGGIEGAGGFIDGVGKRAGRLRRILDGAPGPQQLFDVPVPLQAGPRPHLAGIVEGSVGLEVVKVGRLGSAAIFRGGFSKSVGFLL